MSNVRAARVNPSRRSPVTICADRTALPSSARAISTARSAGTRPAASGWRMIKVGKTYGNLMVDVRTGSEKLRDRARRILGVVTGIDYDTADALLKRAEWNVKAAIVMQKTGLSRAQALKRLKNADDSIREAIGEDIEPRLRELLKAK